MDLIDLDDDELAHLALWLKNASPDGEAVDLRQAPAWRFAESRRAVDADGLSTFPEIDKV